MKRIITIAIATVFVLGLAASAFAIHAEIPAETTAAVAKGGTTVTIGGNIRTRTEWCENCTDVDDDAPDHWTRWDNRIRLNITAQVSDATTGYMSIENFYVMGTNGDGAVGVYPQGNNRGPSLDMLEGWINHSFGPVGLKIGHMPLALGNNLFFDHTLKGDDAAILYANPVEAVHIAGLFIRFTEAPALINNDNSDAYVVLANYTSDVWGIGGDITWVNDNTGAEGLDLYNIGVRGNVNVGPAAIKADVEVQTGDVNETLDWGGNAAMVAADFKLGPASVGVEVGQGTGDDDPTDDSVDIFVTTHNGRVPYIAYVYDTRIVGACGVLGGGICNTQYAKVKGGASITDALSINGALIFLKATEDVALLAATDADNEIGTELDAVLAYQLDRNLKLSGEFGYLAVGEAYGSDADDAFAVRGVLELSF